MITTAAMIHHVLRPSLEAEAGWADCAVDGSPPVEALAAAPPDSMTKMPMPGGPVAELERAVDRVSVSTGDSVRHGVRAAGADAGQSAVRLGPLTFSPGATGVLSAEKATNRSPAAGCPHRIPA